MIIFHPPGASPRTHKIGRTSFTVHAYFCGRESIYQKLATLMEAELIDCAASAENRPNPIDRPTESGYTNPDTMPLLSEGTPQSVPGKEF